MVLPRSVSVREISLRLHLLTHTPSLGDTYRWKGENVSTAEVSEVLGSYPGVNEAVVYGVQLPGHDGKAGAAALDIAADQKGSFNYADFLR